MKIIKSRGFSKIEIFQCVERGGGTPRCMLNVLHLEPWTSLLCSLFAYFFSFLSPSYSQLGSTVVDKKNPRAEHTVFPTVKVNIFVGEHSPSNQILIFEGQLCMSDMDFYIWSWPGTHLQCVHCIAVKFLQEYRKVLEMRRVF